MFVVGVGYFELTVNGMRVGAGRKLDVAWTQYAKRVNYVAFDLAPFLRPHLYCSLTCTVAVRVLTF